MVERDAERQKTFTRRAALLGVGKLSLFGALIGRMYYLQVVEADQYRMLAEENRINVRLLPPPRGRILDRFGTELARNRPNFRVLLDPDEAEDIELTVRRLSRLLSLNDGALTRIEREVGRRRPFLTLTLVENLSWNEFAKVNVNLPDLPGVRTDDGERRHYPKGERMAHVVGYVAAFSESELTGDPLLTLPDFRIGKNGAEKIFERRLRGSAGNSRVEVNAFGREIRELKRQEGEPGRDVVLTVDDDLQRRVAGRLAEESAAAVVLDAHTGEVLAMTSTPSFDPGAFNRGLSAKAWKALRDHPRTPLINKAISGQYPPGSVFKMVVALAALGSGLVGAGQRVFCNGKLKLGNHTFYCWRHRYGGHGHVDMREAIEQSCDVYFYETSKRIGIDRIADMARRFGLGEILDIELEGEQPGLVPSKAWKLALTGKPWQQGETLITGIGQGYMLFTPLQAATMTARLATGRAVRPRLLRHVVGDAGEDAGEAPSLGLAARHLEVVREAMDRVVNGRRGTARGARLEGGVRMAGKTGTSQVRRITKAERSKGGKLAQDTPWEQRDHGLFVAYAPLEAPRYALSLIIEHGGSGAKAALVAKDLMSELLRRDPVRRRALGRLAARSTRTGERG